MNVGPADAAPFDNLPWVNIVRISGFETTDTGMPASAEINGELYEIEDDLARSARARGAILVGRLTVGGRRELFFYSATNLAENLCEHASSQYGPDLDFEPLVREDPAWDIYLQFLYPGGIDWQRIHNQKVVQLLSDEGDDLTRERQIDHKACFPDEASRDQFIEELAEDVFTIDDTNGDEDSDLPFTVTFHSVGPADLGSIDAITIRLFVRARELGGAYDGWGCSVTR